MQADQLKNELSNITSNSERSLMAARAYSNIADGVDDAKDLVENSNNAANNATELVSVYCKSLIIRFQLEFLTHLNIFIECGY